jgi:NAD(P)-dependent dehydrogenase (short-subunit alcohol dehydrogenase family)
VSRKEDLQSLVDATRRKWGRIDIVVANAASNPYYGPLTGIPTTPSTRSCPTT